MNASHRKPSKAYARHGGTESLDNLRHRLAKALVFSILIGQLNIDFFFHLRLGIILIINVNETGLCLNSFNDWRIKQIMTNHRNLNFSRSKKDHTKKVAIGIVFQCLNLRQ